MLSVLLASAMAAKARSPRSGEDWEVGKKEQLWCCGGFVCDVAQGPDIHVNQPVEQRGLGLPRGNARAVQSIRSLCIYNFHRGKRLKQNLMPGSFRT